LLAGPAALVMHTAWAVGFGWGLIGLREQRWRGQVQGLRSPDHPLGESA
jgi:hypothetical protein